MLKMNILKLILLWFVLVVSFSQFACADQRLFQIETPSVKKNRDSNDINNCKFEEKLPSDFALFAAGAYSGRKLDFQIDSSGHQVTQMDVVVNHSSEPVVLMLGAYEPTIWNISWTPKTEIIAVMLSGYHKQVPSGLTEATHVLISTDENKGTCGIFYVERHRLGSLNPIARRLFKQEIDMVYFANNGQIVIGDDLPESIKLTQSPLSKPEHYRKEHLSGLPGLEQSVSRGELRKATLEDAYAWVETISKELPPKDIPPVAGEEDVKPRRPLLLNAYVVLKSFTYPDGLFGGNSAVFFIPKGVPKPKGNQGHSTVYDFNTLSCSGSLCNR